MAGASELRVRVVSGLVAIVVALACLWLGGLAWWVLVSALSVTMLHEWCVLVSVGGWRRLVGIAALVLLLLLVLAGELGHPLIVGLGNGVEATRVAPETFIGPIAVLVILTVAATAITLTGRIGWGLLYVGLPAVSLLFLRTGGGGLFGNAAGLVATLLTLAAVWATDIGAFFAGRAIGGPKLAPALSPNKTWAGLIGGMVVAAIVVILVTFVVEKASGQLAGPGSISASALVTLATVGAVGAILAQTGDLFESWLKRRAGVKDSGALLPGHGGALDRLDGLVPVAIAAALLVFFGHG